MAKQDNQRYLIDRFYKQFENKDRNGKKYYFQLQAIVLVNGKEYEDAVTASSRMTGAENFRKQSEEFLKDENLVAMKLFEYTSSTEKANPIGSENGTIIYNREGYDRDDTPAKVESKLTTEDFYNRLREDVIASLGGLQGVQNTESSDLQALREKVAELEHSHEVDKLEDRITIQDKEINLLESQKRDLEKKVEELDKENQRLFQENEENLETIKKFAPNEFAKRVAIGAGAKFLGKLVDGNPGLKEGLGAILDSLDMGDEESLSSSTATPPPTPPQVNVEEKKEKTQIELFIDEVTERLRGFELSQLQDFIKIFNYYTLSPIRILEFIKDNPLNNN